MYIWELVAHRLRVEGWTVWHQRSRDAGGDWTYVVHLQRPGASWRASGPTLTEAFAEAARRAHEPKGAGRAESGPHFAAAPAAACAAR
jgi:hypothetical protein